MTSETTSETASPTTSPTTTSAMTSATTSATTSADLVPRAAAPLLGVIRSLTDADLDRPTPCTDFDIRALLQHLIFWAPSLAAAGTREPVPQTAVEEGAEQVAPDLVAGDWAARLQTAVTGTVAAWSAPQAWEGTTSFGAPPDFPADLVGGMVVGELVVHGWDLARASGQSARFESELEPAVAALLLTHVTANAAMGREMGIYAPEVTVPVTATALHRALGLTGRDPAWISPAEGDRSVSEAPGR